MPTPLRSLSGLLDFECAARWGSFKLAALELHKTAAAVSQQIKHLEQSLGFALFIRHPRHLTVTEKGRELAGTVAKNLRELNAKVAALQDGDDEAVLRISTTYSFAMKWLVPRLHRFTQRHPALDIRVDSNDRVIDLTDASCDVAIRYGRVQEGADAALLFRERTVVVYSPALLAGKPVDKPAATLAALAAYPLLYEGTPENWLRLLREHKLATAHRDFSRSYSHSGVLVQAAVAGHGVALAPYSIACEDIGQGRLLVLPCRTPPSTSCYRLLYNDDKKAMRKIAQFQAWIADETAAMLAAAEAAPD